MGQAGRQSLRQQQRLVRQLSWHRPTGDRRLGRRCRECTGRRPLHPYVDKAATVDDPRERAAPGLEPATGDEIVHPSRPGDCPVQRRPAVAGDCPSSYRRAVARTCMRSPRRPSTPSWSLVMAAAVVATAASYVARSATPAHGHAATPSCAVAHGVARSVSAPPNRAMAGPPHPAVWSSGDAF